MSIKVTCQQCGVTLKTADSAAGKKAKCPKCQAQIIVPMLPADPTPDVASATQDDAWDDFDKESERIADGQDDNGSDREPCPACGEMIIRGAAKCRYCGEVFDANLAKAEKKKAQGDEGSRLTGGEWAVAILCSGIGCICGIVWMIQGKPKGKKMFLVSLAVQGFWFLVRVALSAADPTLR